MLRPQAYFAPARTQTWNLTDGNEMTREPLENEPNFLRWGCSVVLWSQCKILKLSDSHGKHSVVPLARCAAFWCHRHKASRPVRQLPVEDLKGLNIKQNQQRNEVRKPVKTIPAVFPAESELNVRVVCFFVGFVIMNSLYLSQITGEH